MSQPSHIDTDTLSAYLNGAVTPAERDRVEAHLTTCVACRQELAELQATVALLRGLPQYEPRRAFHVAADVRRPISLPVRLLPVIRPLSIAAALLFAIVTGFAFLQDNPDSDLAPASRSEQEAPVGESGGGAAQTGTNRTTQTSLITNATTPAEDAGGDAAGDSAAEESVAQDSAAPEQASDEERPMAALEVQNASPTVAAGEVDLDQSAPVGQPADEPPAAEQPRADERIDGWALASAGLGVVTAGLLVAWAILARVNSRRAG